MYLDLIKYNADERMRLSLNLRKKIVGYNNGVEYSIKKVQTERNTYFEDYLRDPNGNYNFKINQTLNRMNIVHRLAHSSEKKYVELYISLKNKVADLGVFSNEDVAIKKMNETQLSTIISDIYDLYHALDTHSDDLELDFKHKLQKTYPKANLDLEAKRIFGLFRVIETIDDLKQKILKTPLEYNGEVFSEFGVNCDEIDAFPGLNEPVKFEYLEEDPSSDEDIPKVSPKKPKVEEKIEYHNQEEDIAFMSRIEDRKNFFKEFYEKYKKLIFGKEFWELFLSEILSELKSDKTDEQLFFLFDSPQYFNDVEAAHYLIEHRSAILSYYNSVAAMPGGLEVIKKKRDIDVDSRPTNFGVKTGSGKKESAYSSEYAAYDESKLTQTNYEVLRMLGMDEEELKKESKLGLKKQEMPKPQVIKNADEAYDYIHMSPQVMATVLPLNTEKKETEDYCMFNIPAPIKLSKHFNEESLIKVSSFEGWVQQIFTGMKTMNPIQSKVKPIAFDSDENMLVCAPTGAGKTNVALMCILHEIEKFINKDTMTLFSNDFKIVYVSPMKALAAEITEKFSSRLKCAGIVVKELTGDMQLSKTEIMETHIIITTPEKWDVITRKSDGITQKLKLLIIDEIHLLNDSRGPVLECLVARTLRTIERSQLPVRLLGLSATLPNPLDVAQFLRVNPEKGFFFFDQTYRPIPLHQRFIGIKEDKGYNARQYLANPDQDDQLLKRGGRGARKKRIEDAMDDICFDLVRKHVLENSQVMVFVHSRKETIRYCKYLVDKFKDSGESYALEGVKRSPLMGKFKSRDLEALTPKGVGFHNAGLLRRDRNIVEKLFLDGNLRILVTTATLAWGVNLPAHAVVIKGTDVYEPNKDIVDLSILDIQQIFGRAGRPQFDTSGDATLITRYDKVNYYLGLMTNSSQIESQFVSHINESLNAEISLGSISSMPEAKEWLKYTFFYVRLLRNPGAYKRDLGKGKDAATRRADIEDYLQEILTNAITQLHNLRLIRHDQKTLFLNSTELGRIASNYYIKCETMEHFCKELRITEDKQSSKDRVLLTDEKLISIVARAKEFENIKLRPEEVEELNSLNKILFLNLGNEYKKTSTDKNVGPDTNQKVYDDYEKVFALIQGYLLHVEYENSSLMADTIYIVQNCLRILRCILDICIKKNMAQCVEKLLYWCKLIENKMVPDDHPLCQFAAENNMSNYSAMKSKKEKKQGLLAEDLIDRLFDTNYKDLDSIREATAKDISDEIRLRDRGQIIKSFCSYIPKIVVDYKIKPIAQTILQITVNITCEMNWNPRWHLRNEPLWVMVDDEVDILHIENILITKKAIFDKTSMAVSFFIPYRDDNNKVYRLIIDSDRWIGSRFEEIIDMDSVAINQEHMEYTKLLDLQPLPKSALNNKQFELLYPKFQYFNPVQTQVFHALYHTDHNVLVGAPTGSGKTIMAELAMLRVFNHRQGDKVIYIAPLKAIAKERIQDWRERLENGVLKKKVLELTGDFTPDLEALKKSDVLITTPEKWDGISRNWQNRSYVQNVALIIMDEIHLLGQDRGPVLEVIVSRMNYISKETSLQIRMVGLSTALANGVDVANWFGVKPQYFFNFKPAVRPCPIEIHFEGFSEKHYCPRMATMNKPAYNSIKKFSEGKPVLIFVSSRRQTRLTALDLIALIAADMSTGNITPQFLNVHSNELDIYLEHIQDPNLKQTLSFGIGMHHAGLVTEDRRIVEELFLRNKIQILIATSTLAWGVNFPAHLVIIKGTEYFDPKQKKYVDSPVVDLLQMIGRAGRPQFDTHGVACVFVEQSKKNFYRKYLNDPFPVESSLANQISEHLNAEISAGTLKNKQDCIDYLTWTYYFRRIIKNPAFYGVPDNSSTEINKFLIGMVDNCLETLEKDGCVKIHDGYALENTFLGQIASFYYVRHATVSYFNNSLTPDLSIVDLLKVLAYAKEFEEIPLRHNEDNYNEALAKICPYSPPSKNYDSSNLKTFLLFQMYFGRLPPPIRDYVTDAKLAIDGSIRIVMALIDIAADRGFLKTVFNLCNIMQMLVQGIWIHESQFKNIPHFNDTIIKILHQKENITYLSQLISVVNKGELKAIFKKHKIDISEDNFKDVEDCIKYIPDVSFKVSISAYDSDKFEPKPGAPLEEGAEGLLRVSLKRINSQYPLTVQMERYSKIKDAGWWIIVTNQKKSEIMCIKKVTFKDTLKREMQINLPDSFTESPQLDVYLVSDSYIGIDQVYSIKFNNQKKA